LRPEPTPAPTGSPGPEPSRQLAVYDSIADLVPGPDNPTPLLRLSEKFVPHPSFSLFLKLEAFNPFGSIKDRIALALLRGAQLSEGQALVEASSGNTGLALAALANAENIPIEIAVPDGVPEEKKAILRMLGVKLWEAPDDLCPMFPSEGARGLVKSIVESPGHDGRYVNPDQYENLLNVQAHYESTGPEIWRQTGGQLDFFFAGLGTCGTITGVAKYLKERDPAIRVVGIEPASSDHRLPGMKRITGLPDELVPKILDRSLIDDVVEVNDEDAYQTGIRLARQEGVLVGPTTGAILAAALQYAEKSGGRAVAISPDGAFKYTALYSRYLNGSD
jgi:cysteine synthase A/cysteine synthase B